MQAESSLKTKENIKIDLALHFGVIISPCFFT